MDEGIHLGDGEGGDLNFLAEELQRCDVRWQFEPPVFLFAFGLKQPQMALDEQSRRTATGIVDRVARFGIEDAGHDDADLGGREPLPAALPLALGKFPQQVLVSPAQNVRFHVIQAEPVVRVVQDLYECGQPTIIHDPLSGSRGVEVSDVHHAG